MYRERVGTLPPIGLFFLGYEAKAVCTNLCAVLASHTGHAEKSAGAHKGVYIFTQTGNIAAAEKKHLGHDCSIPVFSVRLLLYVSSRTGGTTAVVLESSTVDK